MEKKGLLLIVASMILLCAGVVNAAILPAEQDRNEGGCGGGGINIECPEGTHPCGTGCCPDITPTNKPQISPQLSGWTSYKTRWHTYKTVGCKEYAVYETSRMGVCEPGELRCNVKLHWDRLRISTLQNCVYHE